MRLGNHNATFRKRTRITTIVRITTATNVVGIALLVYPDA